MHCIHRKVLPFLGLAKLMVEADNECNLPCSKKMWDGYGRWNVNDQWKPFMEEINLPSSQSKTVIGKVFL